MKKNIKEIIIGILQLLLFYVLPLFAGPTDAMGMVFLIIVGTFILSLLIGILSNNKIKYFYSVFTSIIFIPSVFIYYNEIGFNSFCMVFSCCKYWIIYWKFNMQIIK